MPTDLSSYNNSWYSTEIGASRLKQFLWYSCNGLFLINPLNPFSGVKKAILRLFGARIGNGVVFKPGINIKYPWKLIIADNSWIGENVWIDNLAPVTIGSHVCISQGAMLLTGNHNYTSPSFDLVVKPITLEDGAWIGAKAVVCPGIHVRSHAMLTAGSVATKEMEAYGIYQGNPALYIKKRSIT